MSNNVYLDLIKFWQDSQSQEIARITRVYLHLRDFQKSAVREANQAIKREDVSKFVMSRKMYRDLSRVINEEFTRQTEIDRKTGVRPPEFPEWPYSEDYDGEDTYILFDELPQYVSVNDTADVPF